MSAGERQCITDPAHKVQCKACPWKKGVKPLRDIPGGYREDKHKALSCTIAQPGALSLGGGLRLMACHESTPGEERVCVGWAVQQMGEGNNLALRIAARQDERFHGLRTVGPQHDRFEDTLPRRGRR